MPGCSIESDSGSKFPPDFVVIGCSIWLLPVCAQVVSASVWQNHVSLDYGKREFIRDKARLTECGRACKGFCRCMFPRSVGRCAVRRHNATILPAVGSLHGANLRPQPVDFFTSARVYTASQEESLLTKTLRTCIGLVRKRRVSCHAQTHQC